MKKLLFILIVLLFSCEKEKTCWECTTLIISKTIWLGTNYSEDSFSSDKEIICDHTEKQIRDFEDSKTYISDTLYIIQNFVRHGYVIKSSCCCTK